MLEHLGVPVHLVLEVLEQHVGWDGGEAEADQAEDETETQGPHRDEDVDLRSVGPGVKRGRIILRPERVDGALYDELALVSTLGDDSGNISGSSVYCYFE